MPLPGVETCKVQNCNQPRVTGLSVCRIHGGSTPLAKAKAERARTVTKMEKFAATLPKGHELNDPIAGFEWEYRRTIGRIMWYDEELAKISEESLVWGKTATETIGATEFTGTNEKFEARVNLLHELQFRERKHLLDMQKIYIGAKLDERKLAVQESYVRRLNAVIENTLRALGKDPNDPATRQVVRDQMLALAPADG